MALPTQAVVAVVADLLLLASLAQAVQA